MWSVFEVFPNLLPAITASVKRECVTPKVESWKAFLSSILTTAFPLVQWLWSLSCWWRKLQSGPFLHPLGLKFLFPRNSRDTFNNSSVLSPGYLCASTATTDPNGYTKCLPRTYRVSSRQIVSRSFDKSDIIIYLHSIDSVTQSWQLPQQLRPALLPRKGHANSLGTIAGQVTSTKINKWQSVHSCNGVSLKQEQDRYENKGFWILVYLFSNLCLSTVWIRTNCLSDLCLNKLPKLPSIRDMTQSCCL